MSESLNPNPWLQTIATSPLSISSSGTRQRSNYPRHLHRSKKTPNSLNHEAFRGRSVDTFFQIAPCGLLYRCLLSRADIKGSRSCARRIGPDSLPGVLVLSLALSTLYPLSSLYSTLRLLPSNRVFSPVTLPTASLGVRAPSGAADRAKSSNARTRSR